MSRSIEEIEADYCDTEMQFIECEDDKGAEELRSRIRDLRRELAQAKKEADQ